jgi:hypothetical protein
MMNFFGNSSSSDDEDEALDGDEVESENMMLTIERYNDHHFESLIEHALHLCLVANSVMPVSEREHHEHVRSEWYRELRRFHMP